MLQCSCPNGDGCAKEPQHTSPLISTIVSLSCHSPYMPAAQQALPKQQAEMCVPETLPAGRATEIELQIGLKTCNSQHEISTAE